MLHNSLVGRHSQVSLSCSATLLISCALLFCVTGCSSNTSNAIASYGTISTVAGTGINGFSGNGGLATNAKLHDPACIALDSASDLFIGDSPEFDIRKVTASTGIITTYAGSQVAGYTGDTGPATLATMLGPSDCATDISGNLYITD
jgi:hypothetical protein